MEQISPKLLLEEIHASMLQIASFYDKFLFFILVTHYTNKNSLVEICISIKKN